MPVIEGAYVAPTVRSLDPLPAGGSPLYDILAAYLRGKGFNRARNGLWGHRELGQGRTFEQVIQWQIGREQAGRG
jgi:hypothetical protein